MTGASGFIAKHIVLQLVQTGYRVRGTVRSAEKAEEVRVALRRHGGDPALFEPHVADLTRDTGWAEAMVGCDLLLHTASPFPRSQPRDKFGLVDVARGGTVRVVRTAVLAGVSRVVLTSSIASIVYGHPGRGERWFGEADVSDVESADISPYAVSKTLAERAAWEEVEGTRTELATINPSLVFGPLLDRTMGTSVQLIEMMMSGRLPVLPDVTFGIVDVRDVAAAHVAALTASKAAGRRFVVSAEERSLLDIARHVAVAHPAFAGRVPRRRLPTWAVKAAAFVSPSARMLAAEIGRTKRLETAPAREILGLSFRSGDEAIGATASSLLAEGLVTP